MFSFVDSRTVLLLVASQVVLLSVVRCQEEDDRKLCSFSRCLAFHLQNLNCCNLCCVNLYHMFQNNSESQGSDYVVIEIFE